MANTSIHGNTALFMFKMKVVNVYSIANGTEISLNLMTTLATGLGGVVDWKHQDFIILDLGILFPVLLLMP